MRQYVGKPQAECFYVLSKKILVLLVNMNNEIHVFTQHFSFDTKYFGTNTLQPSIK